jgi:hypothetical protein
MAKDTSTKFEDGEIRVLFMFGGGYAVYDFGSANPEILKYKSLNLAIEAAEELVAIRNRRSQSNTK